MVMKALNFNQKSKNTLAGETSSPKILFTSPSSGQLEALIYL
jgi:hypothetical protein